MRNCKRCPAVKDRPFPTGDWFENVTEWLCSEKKDRHIGTTEPFDDVLHLPQWCPRAKLKQNKKED